MNANNVYGYSSSQAVQDYIRELREKDARELVELRSAVESAKTQWEAEILFEIEKDTGFMPWLSTKLRPASKNHPQPYRPGLTIREIAENVIAKISIPPEYTLENEQMRLRSSVVSYVIDSFKESLRLEALAEQQRVAATALAEKFRLEEVALIAAEEKAAAVDAWKERYRIAIDLSIEKFRKTIKTPWHSFTGVDATGRTMYILYDEPRKILRCESKRFVFTDPEVTVYGEDYRPTFLKAPVEWNNLFDMYRLPFLTCCPVCSDQITLRCYNGQEIGSVACASGHYTWDIATNLHYRNLNPPLNNLARGFLWDPRDPDGSIAARAARGKKIAETKAEIVRLQEVLGSLERYM